MYAVTTSKPMGFIETGKDVGGFCAGNNAWLDYFGLVSHPTNIRLKRVDDDADACRLDKSQLLTISSQRASCSAQPPLGVLSSKALPVVKIE